MCGSTHNRYMVMDGGGCMNEDDRYAQLNHSTVMVFTKVFAYVGVYGYVHCIQSADVNQVWDVSAV